ncbi:MAG: branched-chain amino acid aminotransferase [Flavobacteriales bacterium]|nr:branched-chain amino acid aminotransferase [Flavobacteriales bacterium]
MKITRTQKPKIDSFDFDNAVFGNGFSDHMLIATYENNKWSEPEIVPYGPLGMTPAIQALHYGQAVFEGMKAYKDENDDVFLFRPEKNFHRFNKSCKRLAMPEISEEIFLGGISTLIDLDRDWVPSKLGTALYIRPFMFASEELLSARPSTKYTFCVLCAFANNYYSKPLRVKIANHYSRSASGGVGSAKAAGNYAASFYPTRLVNEEGFDQIIWTDAATHTYFEESGTMNIMLRINDEIITPPVTETILDGITRNSLIQLAKKNGITVKEERVTVKEVYEAHKNGTLKEVFGCGTAVIVNRFSAIGYENETLELPIISDEESYAQRLKNQMQEIQYNLSEDEFGWRTLVERNLQEQI